MVMFICASLISLIKVIHPIFLLFNCYFRKIDVFFKFRRANIISWSRFFVISTLFCCGGFIYKTQVQKQVGYFNWFCLLVKMVFLAHVFSYRNPTYYKMQHGIDALPGMTIFSACLETVSEYSHTRIHAYTEYLYMCKAVNAYLYSICILTYEFLILIDTKQCRWVVLQEGQVTCGQMTLTMLMQVKPHGHVSLLRFQDLLDRVREDMGPNHPFALIYDSVTSALIP